MVIGRGLVVGEGGEELVDFGGADEVVFGETADGVGGVAHRDLVVAEVDVGVVVFAVGDEGGGVYEGEGFVVVFEFEGTVEDVVDDGPVGDFGEEEIDLGVGEGGGAGGEGLAFSFAESGGHGGPFGKGERFWDYTVRAARGDVAV